MLVWETSKRFNDQENLIGDGVEREGWVCLDSRSATEEFDFCLVDCTSVIIQDTVLQALCGENSRTRADATK